MGAATAYQRCANHVELLLRLEADDCSEASSLHATMSKGMRGASQSLGRSSQGGGGGRRRATVTQFSPRPLFGAASTTGMLGAGRGVLTPDAGGSMRAEFASGL